MSRSSSQVDKVDYRPSRWIADEDEGESRTCAALGHVVASITYMRVSFHVNTSLIFADDGLIVGNSYSCYSYIILLHVILTRLYIAYDISFNILFSPSLETRSIWREESRRNDYIIVR